LGKADAYVNGTLGMCLWDVCPGEVIVKGMGGYITNFNLNRYYYAKGASPLIQGVFAARSKSHYNLCVKRMGGMLKTLQALL